MKTYRILAFSFAWSATAWSADQHSSAEEVDPVMIVAGTTLYPSGAAERGVQGTTTIRADLLPDGSFSNPTVQESSRSEELDSAALALVPRLKYSLTKSASGPAPTSVLVPIAFQKDSLERLRTKTCADFNLDAGYFREAFSDKSITDMPVFDITAGILVFVVKAEQRLALAKNLKRIKEQVVAECAQSPDKKFLEVAIGATTDGLTSFATK